MSQTNAPELSWHKFLSKGSLFVLGMCLLYVASLLLLKTVSWQGHTLLTRNTGNFVLRGGDTFTLQRFEDAGKKGHVDILFCGSSRSYTSFDPEPFEQAGFSTFDIGSAAQTPLNTYYLLKKYEQQFAPRLVVYEVTYKILALDGLESYYDLLVNCSFSTSLGQMCYALGSPPGYHETVATLVHRVIRPKSVTDGQLTYTYRHYVKDGFATTPDMAPDTGTVVPSNSEMRREQLDYIQCAVRYLQDHGVQVVFAIAPYSQKERNAQLSYEAMKVQFREFSDDLKVPVFDFSESLHLDQHTDFFDIGHVNERGALVFSQALRDTLIASFPNLLNKQ